MRQIDLNRLTVFVAVVDAGGFTAAADRLGATKSQVSLQVSRLEEELGVALLTRTTRRVVVTEAGESLHAECAPLLTAMHEAVGRVGHAGGAGRLEGRLRITAGLVFSDMVLGPLLAEFATLHPSLDIELVASDTSLDLVADGIDLAIRGGVMRDSSLKAVRLGAFAQLVVASPALLARVGTPSLPEQLNGQPWVALTVLGSPLTWQMTTPDGGSAGFRARSAMRVNSATVAQQCARAGVGFTVLPDYIAQADLDSGRLVRVLPDWSLPEAGVYAAFPAVRFPSAKVRAMIDFLRPRLD